MSRKNQPRFLFKLRVGAPDGDPVDADKPDYSAEWLWTGGASRMVRHRGKPCRLERAIYQMFSGKEVMPGFHVRRVKGSNPEDFRPFNFYAIANTQSVGFSLTREQADLVEFLQETGVNRLSSLEEEFLLDLTGPDSEYSSEDIRVACDYLLVVVDIDLPDVGVPT